MYFKFTYDSVDNKIVYLNYILNYSWYRFLSKGKFPTAFICINEHTWVHVHLSVLLSVNLVSVFLCINISVRALVSTLLTNVCVSVIKLLSSAQDSHLSLTSRNGVWQPVAKTIITQHTDSLYQSVLTRIKIISELLLLKRSNYLHTKVGWGTKIWKKEGKFQLVSPPFLERCWY